MTLLVTRPEPQASSWATALRAEGVAAQALPLIAIGPPRDAQPLACLWSDLPAHRALMFVSPAAVSAFFAARPPGTTWPAGTWVAAPGPGTAQALVAAGQGCGLAPAQVLAPAADAAQFDSEHLWPVLAPLAWTDQKVAIVSGGSEGGAQGRDWLTQRWREAGADVRVVQAYRRVPGDWCAAQRELACTALAQPSQATWLLSSSQALDFLLDHHLPALGPDVWRPPQVQALQVLCTHPRIADHARARGIRRVETCAPTLASVVQARRLAG